MGADLDDVAQLQYKQTKWGKPKLILLTLLHLCSLKVPKMRNQQILYLAVGGNYVSRISTHPARHVFTEADYL